MSTKTKNIIAFIVSLIPAVMLVFSGVLKLTGSEKITAGLTSLGFGAYIKLFGAAEIIFAILFLIPKTYKIGFFLVLSYLGGAAAIEVSTGQPPVALVLIALSWIGFYLKDKHNFLVAPHI